MAVFLCSTEYALDATNHLQQERKHTGQLWVWITLVTNIIRNTVDRMYPVYSVLTHTITHILLHMQFSCCSRLIKNDFVVTWKEKPRHTELWVQSFSQGLWGSGWQRWGLKHGLGNQDSRAFCLQPMHSVTRGLHHFPFLWASCSSWALEKDLA